MESRRNRYIRAQVYDIAPRWSEDGVGIQFDEKDCNWLIIPKYPLPERWKQRYSPLLIIFPEQYPIVPPTGFYLKANLWNKRRKDPHYSEGTGHGAPDLSAEGWWWYCAIPDQDVRGGWRPSSDPLKPDNLWTFLNMVREVLTTDNRDEDPNFDNEDDDEDDDEDDEDEVDEDEDEDDDDSW